MAGEISLKRIRQEVAAWREGVDVSDLKPFKEQMRETLEGYFEQGDDEAAAPAEDATPSYPAAVDEENRAPAEEDQTATPKKGPKRGVSKPEAPVAAEEKTKPAAKKAKAAKKKAPAKRGRVPAATPLEPAAKEAEEAPVSAAEEEAPAEVEEEAPAPAPPVLSQKQKKRLAAARVPRRGSGVRSLSFEGEGGMRAPRREATPGSVRPRGAPRLARKREAPERKARADGLRPAGGGSLRFPREETYAAAKYTTPTSLAGGARAARFASSRPTCG